MVFLLSSLARMSEDVAKHPVDQSFSIAIFHRQLGSEYQDVD
jgi:hypothetical protein